MKNHIVFDIETVALPEAQLLPLLPEFSPDDVKLGNTKDPEKVAAKVQEARQKHRETFLRDAALSPMTAQVAMVGFMYNGTMPDLLEGDETHILQTAFDMLQNAIWRGDIIAGFNCHSFDLPFLVRRAWHLGVPVPSELRKGRFWTDSLLDLREMWLMGDRHPAPGTSSLAALSRFLGLPPKLGDGAAFYTLSPEDRRAYLTRDLEVTEALYQKLHQ